MKRRDIRALKGAPPAELLKMLKERRERLRSLRFDLAAGKVKNVSELRAVRKEIARLLTLLRLAETAEAKQ
jgi:large subunit ribosomal protein L29